MRIIRAIIAGERDPAVLASMRDTRCHSSVEVIEKALRPLSGQSILFVLEQALALYDVYQQKVAACDARIESVLKELSSVSRAQGGCQGRWSGIGRGAGADNRTGLLSMAGEALHSLLGKDLTRIHGIGPYLALKLVSECGDESLRMAECEALHLLALSGPQQQISGGKVLSSRTRPSGSRAASLLRLAAVTIGRTETALGAFYRRLSARIGKAKARQPRQRKIARAISTMLCVTASTTSILTLHITRRAIESGLSKIFTGAPRPSASFCRRRTFQFPSKLFLRKADGGILRESPRVRYAFIERHRMVWPVATQCPGVGRQRPAATINIRRVRGKEPGISSVAVGSADNRLAVHIKAIFNEVKGAYGWSAHLARTSPARHSRWQGARCETDEGARPLAARGKRKFKATTNSAHNLPVSPNLLERKFLRRSAGSSLDGPTSPISGRRKAGSILRSSSICSAVRLSAFAMNERMTRQLVIDALRMAWFRRRPASGLIFHSDRGSQYASGDFQKQLAVFGMRGSMSRKGDCWDNAVSETLFGSLKVERLHAMHFVARRQAKDEMIDWLRFYNHRRLHSTLGYLSPMAFEKKWLGDDKRIAA